MKQDALENVIELPGDEKQHAFHCIPRHGTDQTQQIRSVVQHGILTRFLFQLNIIIPNDQLLITTVPKNK